MVLERRLSLDEFLGMPDEKPALEFVDGVLIQKMAPGAEHAALQGSILRQIESSPLASRFRTLPELRCVFGDPPRSYVPDVVVALRRRFKTLRGRLSGNLDGPPDIAIEVLSPHQSAAQMLDKIAFYLSNGVRLVLVVDEERSQITAQWPDAQPRVVSYPDMLELTPVIPGLLLTLRALFDDLKEPDSE